MEDKRLRLTELEQDAAIVANQQNIASNGVLIDINTTDIAEIKTQLESGPVSQETIGSLEDLTTIDKTDIVSSINEVNGIATSNTTKNEQQDIAIATIASDVAATKNDGAEVTTVPNSNVSTTEVYINNVTIIEDFNNSDLVTISNTPTYTLIDLKTAGTLQLVYSGNATQGVGNTPVLRSELVDITTGTVLKTKDTIMEFSGTSGVTAFDDFFSKIILAPTKIALRVKIITASSSIIVNDAKIDILVFGAKAVGSTGTDENTISTNNLGGSTNVKGDIAYLNTNKANQLDLLNLTTDVSNNETNITTNSSAIAGLDNRVEANEESILDIRNDILANTNLGIILDMLIPVGFITISPVAPTYGTWELIGSLADGQAIIGGTDSDGEIKSHDHYMFSNQQLTTDTSTGDILVRWRNVGTDTDYLLRSPNDGSTQTVGKTSKTGGSQNKAWGLGIGTVNIYRRVS